MNVGIAGLGLIGGSLAEALKLRTAHAVYGCDRSDTVKKRARLVEAIDGELTPDTLSSCDIVLIALYPAAATAWLREHADRFKPGAVVVDCCGIKQAICEVGRTLSAGRSWRFVGGHPMAGSEKSGFASARATLFSHATMILTPCEEDQDPALWTFLKRFFLEIGFERIRIMSAESHDRMVAYTSQLAHIVSGAYIRSPTASGITGCTGGSFRDMTRVATLVPEMWSELFLGNREALLSELDGLLTRLGDVRSALAAGDGTRLEGLLAAGRDRKARVDRAEKEPEA